MPIYEPIEGERWAPIPDFPYKISDHGRIIRAPGRYRIARTIATVTDRNGYSIVWLCVDGARFQRKVHRLVAEAFCEKRPFATQVNHKDANKANSLWSNLEWVTPKENIRHAEGAGLIRYGARHPMAKLTAEQVAEIRRIYAPREKMADYGKRLGVTASTICAIARGRSHC